MQPDDTQMYDPEHPTGDDEMYDPEHPTGDGEQPLSYASRFPELDASSDRLQDFADGEYLWHRSMPGCYIEHGTGEFVTAAGQRTGRFFLKMNLFRQRALTFGDEFYLVPAGDGSWDANSFAATADDATDDSIYVPWAHIMQHTYDHMTEFDIKEVHTFWPPGTSEAQVLGALVDDLNTTDGRNIVWDAAPNTIKTFFLAQPADPSDRYSPAQLSDLSDLLNDT